MMIDAMESMETYMHAIAQALDIQTMWKLAR